MTKPIEFIAIVILMAGTIAGAIEFGQIGSLESIANLANVFSGLGWFLGAFAIASLLTAYLVVIAPTKVVLRFLAIPAWLIFSLSLLVTIDQFMGYSYPAIPPQAKVIAYHVLKDENKVKTIEAWMWLKDEGRARAYNFPWTLEREKALHEGQRGAQKGEPVEVDLNPAPSGESIKAPMVIYDWALDPNVPGKNPIGATPRSMQNVPDPADDGYKRDFDGEIEILDPKKPTLKKHNVKPRRNSNPDPTRYGL